MSNPFESTTHPMFVLLNDEQQMSLWPAFTPVPDGWRAAFGPAVRTECLAYIEREWGDLRPASLR
ncbi:MbtH family protein [Streptomyces ipomoeae]|jgi:MbtH protein|uniref:MbtH-like protein n=3 Tax=Streptomyces ipomoeae TaxID=103232 RepID=I3P626_9ACTN|nr:MbtH family protein [Streptomyces ipomoeae]AEL30516.1 MbtH-like protein [Streptomyces ipomoeae 91-03]EKX60219.1 MbtH-like protein [Streptomyces ipomoeae 91-03]MDX2696550.1 MbtH family protein [Streptomyces ipomoeae]MDX2826438.1 MbtH family protein [Streptomyces ipomoeae]MDX2842862.1 MbtH family protein [Streptomyces ipomoeae]